MRWVEVKVNVLLSATENAIIPTRSLDREHSECAIEILKANKCYPHQWSIKAHFQKLVEDHTNRVSSFISLMHLLDWNVPNVKNILFGD